MLRRFILAHLIRPHFFFVTRQRDFKGQALAILTCIDGGNIVDRDRQRLSNPIEACGESNQLVTDYQLMRRFRSEIENNLTVFDILARHSGASIDDHRQIRRTALVYAPLMDGADQVRLGRRNLSHRRNSAR